MLNGSCSSLALETLSLSEMQCYLGIMASLDSFENRESRDHLLMLAAEDAIGSRRFLRDSRLAYPSRPYGLILKTRHRTITLWSTFFTLQAEKVAGVAEEREAELKTQAGLGRRKCFRNQSYNKLRFQDSAEDLRVMLAFAARVSPDLVWIEIAGP